MKFIALFLLLILSGTAVAQDPSAATRREISQLFAALERSQCEFYRNGSWHGTQEASDHLRRKYDYLLKKRRITSAESFIDLAASKSSLSGKAYRVRCPAVAPVSGKAWFTAVLAELRAAPASAH